MRFQRPLDTVLDSRAKVRILRFLCLKGGEWNGRRFAKELAMSPVTAHAALRELHQATILDFRRVGRNHVYSLRDEHDLVRETLRPLFEQEAQTQERLLKIVRNLLAARLRRCVVSAAVYGSVARGQERPTSDIDLFILVRSERDKQEIRPILDHLWEKVTKRFGNSLALYVNTVREGQRKYRRGVPVFRNILQDHRVVWGKPLEEVLSGRPA